MLSLNGLSNLEDIIGLL